MKNFLPFLMLHSSFIKVDSMATNHGLWNRNFCLLVLANVFLFMSVYMLFPVLHGWIQAALECDELHAALITSVFGIAPFLSGPFNAYLVDRFKRKHVCVYSILLLSVITVFYGYVSDVRWMIAWLLLQGAMFGVALMSMGSTLVIDVTPSRHRDGANACFTWAGLVGMLAGIVLGIEGGGPFVISSDGAFMLSACLALVSVVLVSAVRVCFRAPLDVPLLSFDRFLLFRTCLSGLNMMTVPVMLGFLLGTVGYGYTHFYLYMGAGFFVFLPVSRFITLKVGGRLLNGAGMLLMLAALGILGFPDFGHRAFGCAGVLAGLGLGLSLYQFLRMMILLPLHCERGTGYHTFQLLWGVGVTAGYLLCQWESRMSVGNPFVTAFVIGVAGLLFYQLYVHRYYIRKLQDADII